MKKATKKMSKSVAVLVGTDRNALVYGYTNDDPRGAVTAGEIELVDARQIVYWPRETRGAFSIASNGVSHGSRVSHAAPMAILRGVVTVLLCSEAATKSIEAAPWA